MNSNNLRLYTKYNRIMLFRIIKFVNHHKETLNSDDYAKKAELFKEVKNDFERINSVQAHLSDRYLAGKKLFETLYHELYVNGTKSEAYIVLLENNDKHKINEKEKLILNVFRHGLNHFHIPKKYFPHISERRIFMHQLKHMSHDVFHEIKHIASGSGKVAACILLFFMMNSFVSAYGEEVKKPFISDNNKKINIGKIFDKEHKQMQDTIHFIRHDTIAQRLPIDEYTVKDETDKNNIAYIKQVEEWIDGFYLDKKEIQAMIFTNDVEVAGTSLRNLFAKKIGDKYNVAIKIYDNQKDSVSVPLHPPSILRVNKELEDSFKDSYVENEENVIKRIFCGMNDENQLVIILIQNVRKGNEHHFKQVNIVFYNP